jgi:hypothetical protein
LKVHWKGLVNNGKILGIYNNTIEALKEICALVFQW